MRELHIYGEIVPTYGKLKRASLHNRKPQHSGFGGRLLEAAEQIAIENGCDGVAIISGIGVREYYARKGYVLEQSSKQKGAFLIKRGLLKKQKKQSLFFYIVVLALLFLAFAYIYTVTTSITKD